jgi:branched-chain amino acid transport system permease protein
MTFLKTWQMPAILGIVVLLALFLPQMQLNLYVQMVLMYVGINIILTASLNLVNGYMGEFSVGHAAFMAIGAYASSILTVLILPRRWGPAEALRALPVIGPELANGVYLVPAVLVGGAIAAVAGLVLAFPSFKTRGDYLAIVTLAFNMIVKSLLENSGDIGGLAARLIAPLSAPLSAEVLRLSDAVGGPRGLLGMSKLTSLFWVYLWVIVSLFAMRNFIFSNFGRGVVSIREDETAAGLVSVNTRQVKVLTFVVSSFFAGVAGGLFAHVLQFINPRSFTILKSTDILVMVYLGGIGSLMGSILGAAVFTILLEVLREVIPLVGLSEVWRWVVGPLLLVTLMIFRPRGIMGLREFKGFLPKEEEVKWEAAPAPP